MAKVYGVDIGQHLERLAKMDPEGHEIARVAYGFRGKRTGMSERAWVAAEIVKMAWRSANPAITSYWKRAEDMAVQAVMRRGETITGCKVKMVVRGSFLWVRLPSGRALCYPYPRLVEKPWDPEDPKSGTKTTLCYMGVNSVTRKWEPTYGYGGLLAENWTQAASRDVLVNGMINVERAGYPIVMDVHDEIISEPKLGFGSKAEFERLKAGAAPLLLDVFGARFNRAALEALAPGGRVIPPPAG
jgi:DNA polymerase